MGEIVLVAVLGAVWVVLGLGVALVVGRVVRRGDEDSRFFGSWHARRTGQAPPRRADRRSDDRDG
ncbi:hypothetical protein [Microbacterium sp. zg.Y909]|uniref:hypothetical protein n=1 Tax=Microbacterium sp. zg.Y909 TaxID=2969413 RepID=UPI00214CCB44|nr:hypothetical protein [Microbacterium sp. zg.Y909]MCR2825481.1 hypothetical protein [Microbacterium sp. zg.Y909]